MQIRFPHANILPVVVFQFKKILFTPGDNILFNIALSGSDLDIMTDISSSHWQERQKVTSQVPLMTTKLASISAFYFTSMLLKMFPIYTLMAHSQDNHISYIENFLV